jgi:hypothetical protein
MTGYFTVDDNYIQSSNEDGNSGLKITSMLDATVDNLLRIYQVLEVCTVEPPNKEHVWTSFFRGLLALLEVILVEECT